MARILISTLLTLLWITPALAQTQIHPTIPGTTVRDYSQPGYVIEQGMLGGQTMQPTLPGTSVRDYSQPGYVIERDFSGRTTMNPTIPGTSVRDFSKPGFIID